MTRMLIVAAFLVGGCADHVYVQFAPESLAERPSAPTAERQPVSGRLTPLDQALGVEAQARKLSSLPRDPTHPGEIASLRAMADTVEALGHRDEARRAREAADALERSPRTAVHSDSAKAGLQAILDGLGGGSAAAREAVDRIDARVPFLRERRVIDDAFVAVSHELVRAAQRPAA